MRYVFLIILGVYTILPKLEGRVRYPEGSVVIDGIQLLQDFQTPLHYYYLPPAPQLSMRPDSSYEFLFIKYVGKEDSVSGGLFHALIEYSLPQEEIDQLEKSLRKKIPGAEIVGQVPLLEAMSSGQDGQGSFQIVSSVLNEDSSGNTPFTHQIITSGHAPIFPGSKAAIAARLTQFGATLLWHSFNNPTSDVSVVIKAYYEAETEAYNATVKASLTAVYEHFLTRVNDKGYSRDKIRTIVDSLHNEGIFVVDVFDRHAGTVINKNMDHILQVITDKLIDVMFVPIASWSESGSENKNQNLLAFGLREVFFTLADRKVIRKDTFTINLVKRTIVKVPVIAAGNLSTFFINNKEDNRYYQIVSEKDPAFERRKITFQVDGAYIEVFKDMVNFVTVEFRKEYPDHEVIKTVTFDKQTLESNNSLQSIEFLRFGSAEPDWITYDYRTVWSLRGKDRPLRYPADSSQWLASSDAFISLKPPLDRHEVEIDADRLLFQENKIYASQIQFVSKVMGIPQVIGRCLLRHNDAESTNKVILFNDPEAIIGYKIIWYSSQGAIEKEVMLLENDYLFLLPPQLEDFKSLNNE